MTAFAALPALLPVHWAAAFAALDAGDGRGDQARDFACAADRLPRRRNGHHRPQTWTGTFGILWSLELQDLMGLAPQGLADWTTDICRLLRPLDLTSFETQLSVGVNRQASGRCCSNRRADQLQGSTCHRPCRRRAPPGINIHMRVKVRETGGAWTNATTNTMTRNLDAHCAYQNNSISAMRPPDLGDSKHGGVPACPTRPLSQMGSQAALSTPTRRCTSLSAPLG